MKLLLALVLVLFPAVALAAPSVSIEGLVWMVVYLLCIGAVLGLLILLVRKAPFLADPIKTYAEYLIYVIGVLVLIFLLLDLAGSPIVNFRR